MLTSASHTPAQPANPIEKTLAKVLGGFERTPTGALDSKKYAGSLDFEFSKSWRGLKVKELKPGQDLTASQKSKRKAGEDAVITDIRQSTRSLNLDGTALIQAIKGRQRLAVGHVLDCVRWMEFAASFKENMPQVAALVLHLAAQGKQPDAIDRVKFEQAALTMRTMPSCNAQSAWQHAIGNHATPREPHVQRETKSQAQPPASTPTDLEEAMFTSSAAARETTRESKRDDSPTTIVVHEAQAPAPQPGGSIPAPRHALTPPAPVVSQSSSSVATDEAASRVAEMAQGLMAAKGGDKLNADQARRLAEVAIGLAGVHNVFTDEMELHAKAVLLERKMATGTRMVMEPKNVTPLRQPLREFLAAEHERAELAKHAVRDHTPRAVKVFAVS